MAEQAEADAVQGHAGGAGPGYDVLPDGPVDAAGEHESFHGRPVAWTAVTVIFAGFVVGGVALIAGDIWWLFWLGVAIAIVGGIAMLATRVLDDWY